MTALERTIAEGLLKIGAVQFRPSQPFRWSSGLHAPVYCDNRISLSQVALRTRITDAFMAEASGHSHTFDAVAGTATAGIPYATLLADRMELPLAYVRGAQKKYGKRNRIEGKLKKNDRVLLVEDLVSTGGSALSAAEALRQGGMRVPIIFSVVTYELNAAVEAFEEMNISLYSILSFSTLVDIAEEEGYISGNEADSIRSWHAAPEAWSRQAEATTS